MSNKPLILTDNLFDNVVLHPTYVVGNSVIDDVAGHETFRVADNLRDMTSWTVSTANLRHVLYVDALANCSPNTVILDRGHNLAGKQFYVNAWTDTTLTTNVVTTGPITMPSSPGGLPGNTNGCLTPDGLWWKTFTPSPARVWGIQIESMGSGLAPLLTGVHLGISYRFSEFLNAPGAYDYGTQIKYLRNELSRGAVRSKSRALNFDRIAFSLHQDSADYLGFEAEIRRVLRFNVPCGFAFDDSDTSTDAKGQMRLFQLPGDLIYDPAINPVHREIRGELEELIPTLYT